MELDFFSYLWVVKGGDKRLKTTAVVGRNSTGFYISVKKFLQTRTGIIKTDELEAC